MHLSGRLLLSVPEEILISRLKIYEDEKVYLLINFHVLTFYFYFYNDYYYFFFQVMETFKRHLYWLKKQDTNRIDIVEDVDVPHEFLCPITHEIMREPVQCSGKKKKKKKRYFNLNGKNDLINLSFNF